MFSYGGGTTRLTFKEEERVMIHLLHPSVQMQEGRDILALGIVDHIARLEVEASCVELERLGKVCDAAPEMAQLVHRCRALFEALRLVDGTVLRFGIVVL
jgi:adenylosuccinate synthase